MIWKFNPNKESSLSSMVYLNDEIISGVVFADDEIGLVYSLESPEDRASPKEITSSSISGVHFQKSAFVHDPLTDDYKIYRYEGKVRIELELVELLPSQALIDLLIEEGYGENLPGGWVTIDGERIMAPLRSPKYADGESPKWAGICD